MNGGERNMRMELAYRLEDSLRARMVRRRQQRLDDREALRRYGESALAAAIGEMFHPFARVGAAAAVTDYLQIHTRW